MGETLPLKVGLIVGAVAAIPSAAALAVAGLPLLFAGIGIAAAAQSERVKAAFTSLKDHVVAQVQEMARPFEPVLIGIANRAQATFDRIGPSLSRIFSDVAPMVDRLATAVLGFVEGVMPGFETAIDNAKPVIDALARGIERMGPAIGDFFVKISEQSGPAAEAMDGLFDVIIWLVDVLGDALAFCLEWKDVLIPLGLTIAGVAAGIKIVTLAIEAWKFAQMALNLVMAMNPIVAAIAIIAALAAGVIYCYQHFESFRNVVDTVWAAIKTAFTAGVDWVKSAFQWFNDLPGRMADWFGRAKDAAVAKLDELRAWVNALPERVHQALAGAATFLLDRGRELITGLFDGVKAIGEEVIRWVADLPRRIIEMIAGWAVRMYESGAGLMQSFADGINSKATAAQDAAGNVVGGTAALFPQSPAKQGPFSGQGYTLYRGQKLIDDFGRGISDAAPRLADLARQAMEGAKVAISGFTGGGGGTVTGSTAGGSTIDLRVAPGVDSALSSLLMNLVRTGQLQLTRA
ncbi:MAG TPA: hypothetical protein VIU11_09510 [Nakamurella sp.]